MAPRRVIEDSDEDDGGFGTPELLSPSVVNNEADSVSMMQPSSTDPMLFRAVYEEHLGQLLVDDQLPKDGPSPVFGDPIIDQRMSSSASVPSARKLKRSKTTNVSSLSSITEPTISNQKAKRTESMKSVDDLTQITTPRKSKDATWKDSWEVPTSSASDRPLDMNAKVKSRNADRKNPLKTYGRQLRRTQTVAHTPRSTSTDRILSSPPEYDMAHNINQNRSIQNEEDDDILMPRSKRDKVGPSVTVRSPEPVQTEPLATIRKGVCSASSDTTSIGIGSMHIQVQRSASVHAEMGTNECVGVHTQDFNSLSVTTQTNPDVKVEDSYLLNKSAAAQEFRKSISSIVVVPDTLSDEQKLQYEIVSVASTARSPQSSPSAILETIDPKTQYAADLGMASNGTSLPELPLGLVEDMVPSILLSSSPPVSAMNRKMKRAKSEVGSKQMPTSVAISHHNKVAKRKGRSKTIAQGEKPPCREASADELSKTSVESVRRTVFRETLTRTGRKRPYSEHEHELLTTDELHTLDEIGLEEERYQPRPSQRRSKSMSTNASKDGADLTLPRAKVSRKKSLKAPETHSHSAPGDVELSTELPVWTSTTQDSLALDTSLSGKDIIEGRVQPTDCSVPDRIGDRHDSAERPADVPVVEAALTVSTQPKKRGRKKTSEIVTAKTNGVSKTQSVDPVSIVPKDIGVQRKALCEMDSNKQPSQEIASTPPTKASVATVTDTAPPAQTPTQDSKKGPTQHSPLQSGKVAYRVGLSKKTRIAPLLKMIRK